MYGHEKNISHVYVIYEQIFNFCQDGQSVNIYFVVLKGKWDELTDYHPITIDTTVLKQQREEFLVAKFLSELDDSLSHVRQSFLSDSAVPSLTSAFARVLRVSTTTAASDFSPTSVDQSARAASRGCGQGHGRNFPPCIHCTRTNHPSEQHWQEFGKPEIAKPAIIAHASAIPIFETTSDVITVTKVEYDRSL